MDTHIDAEAPDEGSANWLKWVYWAHAGTWDREGAPPHPVDDEQNEYEQRADVVLAASVQTLGGQNIWAGAIPSGLHGRLVARGGLSDAQATKLLAELAKKARDASAGVWRARCKWVNELSTNAETRNRWRTAVRRMAQNHLMAVGSIGAARKMTNPRFAAWRRKIIRWIAGAQWSKGTSDMWESRMVSLTEIKLSNMPVQPRTPRTGGNAQDYKASKRQRLTQAQQASDLAERAQAAGGGRKKGGMNQGSRTRRWGCGMQGNGRHGRRRWTSSLALRSG